MFDQSWSFRLSKSDKQNISDLASLTDRNMSDALRYAIKHTLSELRAINKKNEESEEKANDKSRAPDKG
jgi:predicted DNA-binding protein